MNSMKLNVSYSCLLMLFLFFQTNAQAQVEKDSVTIESQLINSDTYYNLKYEALDIFLRDEIRLFKVSVSPFKPNEKYDFSILLSQLAYERKFHKSWSFIAELNQELMLLSTSTVFVNSLDLGVRNYFNKAKQIRLGLSGNNCNGFYFGAKASGLLRATTLFSEGNHQNFVSLIPMPEMNIGIQQRISNLFYVDANAFVNYNFTLSNPGFGIKVLIGLAISADE